MKVLCLVTERTRTPTVFNNVLHKVVKTVDVRFDETNGSQREHLPTVIDEPVPEETIKFKATEDVIPTEESAEEVIPDCEEHHAGAPEENGSEEILSKFLVVNQLILALQMKCRLTKSSATSTHQVPSHAQKLHIYLTFVGTMLLSLL